MNARLAVIGAVSILALGVFLLTLLFDSPAPDEKPRPRPKPVAPIWSNQKDAPSDQPVLGATRDFAADYLTSKGQLVRIFADQFQPLPQGRAQAKRPRAHIYLAPHRVLTIQAERGRFDVPDNQPRGGDFEGEVILTLLETSQGQTPDLSPAPDNPDRKLQVFLDSVRFDLELGQIDSDQPLRLVAQSVEFQGVGLSMTYNERRKRIERLEVLQAGKLELNRTVLLSPQSNNDNSTTPPPTQSTEQTPEDQLYTVRCQDNVILAADAGRIQADELNLLLTLQADDAQLLGQHPSPQDITPSSIPAPLPAHLASFAIAQTTNPPPEQAQPVHIEWSGRMILEPLDPVADQLTTRQQSALPDEVTLDAVRNGAIFATLRGRPLTIHTPDNDRITAAKLTFLSSTNQITLNGTDTIALEIDSPSRGVVIASQTLNVDQSRQTASLTGTGSLRSRPTMDENDRNTNSNSALPLGLTIHWTEKVDLALSANEKEDQETDQNNQHLFMSQLAGLQSASFQGNVRLRLPDPHVELDADALHIPLVSNHDQDNDEPTRMRATGNASLKIKNNQRQQSLALQANDLSLFLQGDLSGDFHPTELLAQGQVIATDHEQTQLTADNLQTLFKKPSKQTNPTNTTVNASASSTPQAQPAQLTARNDTPPVRSNGNNGNNSNDQGDDLLSIETDITSVIAHGNVHIDMPSRKVTVAADRLHAQPADDLITIEGQDADTPATVNHTDGSLTAPTIRLRPDAAIIETPGPGHTTFATADQTNKNTETPAADALKVAWSDHMRFDQNAGKANFQGHVQTHAKSGRNETNLTTPDLTITFSPQAITSASANSTTNTKTNNNNGDVINAVRAVHQILAQGDATLFATQSWADKPGGKLASRVRLGGTTLRFNQIDEKLHVDGPGWMQIEDYRAPAKNTDNSNNTNQNAAQSLTPQIAFSGRGATLFEWTRGLTIDAAHNDVSMFGNVVMLHRPADQADVMQLNADSLAADMQATGGLDIWLKDNPPTPQLIAVRAAGSDTIQRVRLISGQREVRTDKLTYLASDETILLEAQDGRYTYIIDTGRATSYPAQAIQWDLRQKKITVVNQGAVRSSIGADNPSP